MKSLSTILQRYSTPIYFKHLLWKCVLEIEPRSSHLLSKIQPWTTFPPLSANKYIAICLLLWSSLVFCIWSTLLYCIGWSSLKLFLAFVKCLVGRLPQLCNVSSGYFVVLSQKKTILFYYFTCGFMMSLTFSCECVLLSQILGLSY